FFAQSSDLRLSALCIAALTLVLLLSGCVNQGGSFRKKLSSTSSQNSNSDDSNSPITLSRVVKSNFDPASSLDLFGDGSNVFGKFCVNPEGNSQSTSGTGPSSCKCEFQYESSSGAHETFSMDTTYYESNMIRCRYDAIPP